MHANTRTVVAPAPCGDSKSRVLTAGVLAVVLAAPLQATYSIAACDAPSGQCGIAVQTDNLAVGASVPYARAGVGAVVSQFETHPRHGPRGLALLAEGKSAADVLHQLCREDGNFEGRGIEARQLAIVAANGQAAVHTGVDAAKADWAGARSGPGYSIQGNGLAGPQVLEAMEQAFLATSGSLAERLLAALIAAERAGGQRSGRQSAALLVRTREGFPLDIDLRVDHADDPVGQLGFLYGLQTARQQIIQARLAARRGNTEEARALLAGARNRAAAWPRAGVLAAEVAIELEQPALALDCLTRAFEQNPARISTVLGSGTFALLGADPRFHRWVTPGIEEAALAARGQLRAIGRAAAADSIAVASLLLEAGYANEAHSVLLAIVATADSPAEYFLLQATVFEVLGDPAAAITACTAGMKENPDDVLLKRRMARLQSLARDPS